MTTEKNEVSASEQNNDVTAEEKAQEIVEKVSEQVQDKVQEQVEEKAEEQPKQEVDVAEIVRDTVSKEMNKLRGDQVNWTAQQVKEMRQSIDENLKGYKPAQPTVEEQQPQRDFSQVYSAATGAAMALGLNIDVRQDQRLWEGATPNMTDQQLVQLASQNLSRLKTPQTQQPAKEQPKQENTSPPPSTDGAPKVGNKRFSTISDLASEMASGNINADQYRKGQREIKNNGYTTL